jgi:hypothetical protein
LVQIAFVQTWSGIEQLWLEAVIRVLPSDDRSVAQTGRPAQISKSGPDPRAKSDQAKPMPRPCAWAVRCRESIIEVPTQGRDIGDRDQIGWITP